MVWSVQQFGPTDHASNTSPVLKMIGIKCFKNVCLGLNDPSRKPQLALFSLNGLCVFDCFAVDKFNDVVIADIDNSGNEPSNHRLLIHILISVYTTDRL